MIRLAASAPLSGLRPMGVGVDSQPIARHSLLEDGRTWLNIALNKPADVIGLLYPYAAELLEAYLIDRRINIHVIEALALLRAYPLVFSATV